MAKFELPRRTYRDQNKRPAKVMEAHSGHFFVDPSEMLGNEMDGNDYVVILNGDAIAMDREMFVYAIGVSSCLSLRKRLILGPLE